jgi:hypothetical protein
MCALTSYGKNAKNDRKPIVSNKEAGEMTELCPYCGREIPPPGVRGGRPRRWCSAGCQRAGEAQMCRINLVLKRLELDKAWQQRHSRHTATIELIDAQIAEQQARYDRLAGVPERES